MSSLIWVNTNGGTDGSRALVVEIVSPSSIRITYEMKPGIFEEKRGVAALLFKNSGFYSLGALR